MDTQSKSTALLAFGANLGKPREQILRAWEQIGQHSGIEAKRLSTLYETEAVGGPQNQPKYLNAAGIVSTCLPPEELLTVLQGIENALGRKRGVHWGPRTIDIDLIFYEKVVICTKTLIIPHPRMHERLFVLEPAAEIAASMVHPILRRSVAELKEMLQ